MIFANPANFECGKSNGQKIRRSVSSHILRQLFLPAISCPPKNQPLFSLSYPPISFSLSLSLTHFLSPKSPPLSLSSPPSATQKFSATYVSTHDPQACRLQTLTSSTAVPQSPIIFCRSIDMTGEKSRDFSVAVVFLLLLVLSLPRLHVVAQDDAKELSNGVGLDIFSEFINGQIKNFTAVFKDDIKKHYGFCITDV